METSGRGLHRLINWLAISACLLWIWSSSWAQKDVFVEHLRQAISLSRQGKWEEALRRCDQALAIADSDARRAEALLRKAEILSQRGRWAEAIKAYSAITSLGKPPSYYLLAAWRGMASAASAAGDYEIELNARRQIAAFPAISDSERVMALTRCAKLLAELGRRQEAIKLLEDVTHKFGNVQTASAARMRLLEMYLSEGAVAKARTLLSQSLRAGYPDAEALYARALRLLRGKNLSVAMKIADELISARPASSSAWREVFEIYRAAGKADRFVETAFQRLSRHPEALAGAIGLAEALALSGRSNDARRALSMVAQTISSQPPSAQLLLRAARAALRVGQIKLADKWSERALQAKPKDSQLMRLRAEVLAAQGRKGQAFELLKQSVRFDPADLSSAALLAALMRTAGLDEMLPALAEAVRKATGKPAALSRDLCSYYFASGSYGRAVAELTGAVRAGEVSVASGQAMARSWLYDDIARPEVLKHMEELFRQGQLPASLLPPLAYGLLLAGKEKLAGQVLGKLDEKTRGGAALRIMQWLSADGRSDLARKARSMALLGRLPPETEAQLALGIARDALAAGRPSEAVQVLTEHYKPGLPTATDLAYKTALAEALLDVGRAQEAMAIAERLSQSPAGASPDVILLRARCAFVTGDYDRATELAGLLLSLVRHGTQPTSAGPRRIPPVARPIPAFGFFTSQREEMVGAAMLLRAEAALRCGRIQQALARFQEIIETVPASSAAIVAVQRVGLCMQLESMQEKQRRRFILGLQALDKGEYEQAEELFSVWMDEADNSLADDVRVMLAEAMAASRPDEAARRLEQLAREMPESPLAPYALFRAAQIEAAIRPAGAVRLAKAVTQTFPDSALAPVAEALVSQLQQTSEGAGGL